MALCPLNLLFLRDFGKIMRPDQEQNLRIFDPRSGTWSREVDAVEAYGAGAFLPDAIEAFFRSKDEAPSLAHLATLCHVF